MKNADLVGVWRVLGEETVLEDGTVKPGVPRTAQIMYSADGYMGVVSAPNGRKPVSEPVSRMDLDGASASERAEAAAGCVAYAGRFEVKGDTVHHHIDTALNPNLVGQTRSRRIELKGDDLTLTTLPDADGNYGRIRWRRVARM